MRCSPRWGHRSICLAARSNPAQQLGPGIEGKAVSAGPGGLHDSSCNTSLASAIAGAKRSHPSSNTWTGSAQTGRRKPRRAQGLPGPWGPAGGQRGRPDSEESVQLRHPASCRAACSTPAAFTCPGREQTAEISWTEATSASHSLPRVPGSLLLLQPAAR